MAPFPRFKRADVKGADADAHQACDFVIEEFEHASDLTIEALMNDDGEVSRAEYLNFICSGEAFFQLHSGLESGGIIGSKGAVEDDPIFLLRGVTGVGEDLGKRTIIG